MTPDEAGFFRTILDHPDDDVPRLIYADWLEDRGETDRAEFIRVQCALHRMTENNPNYARLNARHEQLEMRIKGNWPFERWQLWMDFVRGLLHVTMAQSGVDPADLFARFAGFLPKLLACGLIEYFAALSVEVVPAEFLAELLSRPEVQRWVPHLDLGALDRQGIAVIARLTSPAALRSLAVRGNQLGPEGVETLAQSPGLAQLDRLYLCGQHMGPRAVRAVLDSPHLSRVTDLTFKGAEEPVVQLNGPYYCVLRDTPSCTPCIGPEGVRQLAASPGAARLKRLNLAENDIGDAEVDALLASPYLAQLDRLRIGSWRELTLSETVRQRLIERFGEQAESPL